MKTRVLITCGPTWVAIDDVRVMSNISSGRMGHLLAGEFVKNKCAVTMIQGPVTDRMDLKNINIIKYHYFHELERLLKQECSKKYDIVIHAAAVSDFKINRRIKGKLSSNKEIDIALSPAPKLINLIKKISPNSFLVGFKLESKVNRNNLRALTQKLFLESGCDLVLANEQTPRYSGYIVNADYEVLNQSKSKEDIASAMVRILL